MNSPLKILVFGFITFVCSTSYTQTYDTRLEPFYSKAEIQKMIQEDVASYKFIVNALNKALFIAVIPAEKEADIQFDGTLEIDPNLTHTYLSLGLEITDKYQYYKIEGTNQMVVVYPRIFLERK